MNNSNIMQPDETKPVKKEYAFVRKIKTRKLQRKMKFKLLFVAGVVVIAFFLLALRMIDINRSNQDLYSKKVFDNLRYKNSTILAKRGDITDRTGTVLAYSQKVYNLILDPNNYWEEDTDREANIELLVQCLGLDRRFLIHITAMRIRTVLTRRC